MGIGTHEWQGYLSRDEHPHTIGGPGNLLLNWNNRSARGFMHGDNDGFGSVHRVELFDRFPRRVDLATDVSIMNRAATEDVRSPVWPVVSAVLRTGPAPTSLDAQMVDLIDDWVERDAPRLDGPTIGNADGDGFYDDPAVAMMDAAWRPMAEAVMGPVFGDLLEDFNHVRNLGGLAGESLVDKDLRTLLGREVRGKFHLRYCGQGSLARCRASLWAALDVAAATLVEEQGPDPTLWRREAGRTAFAPGLIPDTIRPTNRPTFQQVIELQRP